MLGSFDLDDAVFADGNGHSVLDVRKKLFPEAVDDRHFDLRKPNGGKDRSGGGKRVDRL